MKQSNTAFFITVLGFILFLVSLASAFIFNLPTNTILGIAGMCLLWIMAIQYDLYEYGKEREAKP